MDPYSRPRGYRPVTPVVIVGGTRPLRRHHRRPQRVLRGAGLAEGRALVRLLEALQDQAADAHTRFWSLHALDGEAPLGVQRGVRRGQPEPAPRDRADAAPF